MFNRFSATRTGDRPWHSRFAAVALAALLPAVTLSAQPTAAGPASSAAAGQQAKAAPPAPAAAPLTGPTTDVNTPTIHLGVNEVNLIFTVTDKRGHYIPNLKLSDFALLDDQRAPLQVTSFHQEINLPLRVGIMIDASTSIHTRFQFEQQAAKEFLFQVLKSRLDRAFVMGFDVTSYVTADWTNDPDKLEGGIEQLKPGGGTALFDAVYTACHDKLMTERGQEPVRKAIILLSDGDDNQSHAYLPEAIKECERAETIIYAISTNWTPTRGRGDKILEELADQTGGEVFFPPDAEDMGVSFDNIATSLRSQYALTYTPADFKANGAFRSIYLYCYDRRYIVRARKGYFAPKEQ